MNAPMPGKRRPYRRPMGGWWRRNAYFVEYMAHESTAFFVAAYALILLTGLVRLSQGEAAWNLWLMHLRHPLYIGIHLLTLCAFAYHSWTWFHILPRTIPPVRLHGRRVADRTIARIGVTAAILASSLVVVLVWGVSR